jgi:hypothetical protein
MRRAGLPRRQTLGLQALQGLQSASKFFPQASGVRRMRRTGRQGWRHWACAKQDSAAQWVHAGPEYVLSMQSPNATRMTPVTEASPCGGVPILWEPAALMRGIT